MSMPESVLVAIFVMAVVFAVLLLLSGVIKFFSKGLNAIAGKNKESIAVPTAAQPALQKKQQNGEEDFSSGTLKLKDVDEPTAAMVMAIVSDESGIPLSELVFKSITLREHKKVVNGDKES